MRGNLFNVLLVWGAALVNLPEAIAGVFICALLCAFWAGCAIVVTVDYTIALIDKKAVES